jgi:hypothetical protein
MTDRAGHGDIFGALAHVKDFPIKEQDWVRLDLVHELAMNGQFEIAEKLMLLISDPKTRDSALSKLAGEYAGDKKFAEAERSAHSIQDDFERIQAIARLALMLSKGGQQGHAISLFAEAVATAKQLPSYDGERKTGGAPLFWVCTFNSRDTMLGYVATQQAEAGLDSGADATLAIIEDLPTRAEVRHQLAYAREARVSTTEPASKNEAHIAINERTTDFSPTGRAMALAESGDYARAISVVSELESYEKPYTFGEIARVEVQRADLSQALYLADELPTAEKVSALIKIAETLLDTKDH